MEHDRLLIETPKFAVYERAYHTPQGMHSKPIVVHPGAVCILAWYDEASIVLIRNVRVAVGQELIELPAGTLEPGEDPRSTAHRELREETGFRARSLAKLHEFWMSPGILNERMHFYVATDLTRCEQSLDAGEQIRPLIVPWNQALRMVDNGEIQDAKTLVGLLLYEHLRATGQLGKTL